MRVGFGPFLLDLGTRQLTSGHREIRLTPKAFELLTVLVQQRPRVLSKAELQQRLWPDTFVVEANVANLIAEIRGALGDRGSRPCWIRTAHRLGYAFCGEATTVPPCRTQAYDRRVCSIAWGRRRYPLSVGEYVIGRDPDVEICLIASTVSRRHARLIVTPDGVWLEDLGSKNGTRRAGDAVSGRVPLADGDAIHIGSCLVTFHRHASGVTTETAHH